ncbi:MAG: hypothetical protein ACU0DT_09975, partial [Albimonas sp.]|uniref:hypothetical protein n=1 Tax=Albimonas sp. TaxID=1872425 RepID=UPI004055BE36
DPAAWVGEMLHEAGRAAPPEDRDDRLEPPITATTAERASVEEIIAAIQSSEIVISLEGSWSGHGWKKSWTPPSGGTYVYDEATDSFVEAAAAPTAPPREDALYTLLDADGSVFAYVDRLGGIWVIDDLEQRPPGGWADDDEDAWIYEGVAPTPPSGDDGKGKPWYDD